MLFSKPIELAIVAGACLLMAIHADNAAPNTDKSNTNNVATTDDKESILGRPPINLGGLHKGPSTKKESVDADSNILFIKSKSFDKNKFERRGRRGCGCDCDCNDHDCNCCDDDFGCGGWFPGCDFGCGFDGGFNGWGGAPFPAIAGGFGGFAGGIPPFGFPAGGFAGPIPGPAPFVGGGLGGFPGAGIGPY